MEFLLHLTHLTPIRKMAKDDHIEMEGTVDEAMGGGQYLIRLTNKAGTTIRARLSGKMTQNKIRVIPGDRVRVSVSPYDLTHGMITFRERGR